MLGNWATLAKDARDYGWCMEHLENILLCVSTAGERLHPQKQRNQNLLVVGSGDFLYQGLSSGQALGYLLHLGFGCQKVEITDNFIIVF